MNSPQLTGAALNALYQRTHLKVIADPVELTAEYSSTGTICDKINGSFYRYEKKGRNGKQVSLGNTFTFAGKVLFSLSRMRCHESPINCSKNPCYF